MAIDDFRQTNPSFAVVDRSTVLIKGKIVFDGQPATLQADLALMQSYLGV